MPLAKPSNCLKYVTHTYSPDLVDLTQYVGVTYFKQLESFAGGAYAFAYSKYVNTIVIHTYPYQVF
jgi:hypothetical protein